MSTLKPIKSAYPTESQFLSRFFTNFKGVKSRSISEITKLFLMVLVLLLGYNLSFAQPGSLDPSFDPGSGLDHRVTTTSLQSDGKIIIAGYFNSYNGTERNRIARLNPDGSLDTFFDPGTGANDFITTTSLQSDGKIIIGGWFSSFNGTEIKSIARLNTNGSLDSSFDQGTGPNFFVITTSLQSDGKIIIGGTFTSYNGTERNWIARLKTDGSLDTSFDPGTGTNNWVTTTSLQGDGKIIIGGRFTSYNGTPISHIARLNTDGSLDPSFEQGTGANNFVNTTSLQSNGKIIIAGLFSSYNGTPRNQIARLNTDGSLDTSFDPGTGPNGRVNTISVQSDGKIIIGGYFTSYNGTTTNRVARLNIDGSLDSSFDPGIGANIWVNTTSVQSDGKIIIGGDFTSYNGTEIKGIARLYSTTSTSVNPPMEEESNTIKIFPNPFSTTTTLHSDIQLKNAALTVFNSIGQTVKQITPIHIEAGNHFTLNRDQLPTGLYFIQLSQDNQVIMNDKLVITD